MRKALVILVVVGLLGIASIGYADESYTMWVSIKSSYTIKTSWKKLHKFKSLSSCQKCLLGNREMGIDVVMEKPRRDEVAEIDRIVRHRDDAFTVYWITSWGTERSDWEFQCYPSTFDPRK